MIDHPSYYREDTGHEAIAVIEAWGLNFRLGNCVKYISRAGLKGSRLDDLRKARWYLDREISAMEAEADEEEAEAEDAEAALPCLKARRKGDRVCIVDEDGDAVWTLSMRDATWLADTLGWSIYDADEEPTTIIVDGPEVAREGDIISVRWKGGTHPMTVDDVVRLKDEIECITEGI